MTIDADSRTVFDLWLQLEHLPDILEGVRRVKRIGNRRVLWDVDVAGRQLVWEAELTAVEPEKRIAWESRWGTPNRGELRFEGLGEHRTRVDVDIRFEARGLLERAGARFGVVRRRVQADLVRFGRFVDYLAEAPAH